MALLFSAVTLTGDDDQAELLVPGIPKESNDLRGWTAYENFLASIDHEQEIRVHVAACLYGEGQSFLALGLTLYPMIAAKYNASHQSAIHADYEQILDKTDDAEKERAMELAHQYNEMLKPGVQEAFSQDLLQWASEDYADQLNIAGNGIMGYVVIPNIQVNLPIFHGTADGTLWKVEILLMSLRSPIVAQWAL